MDASDFPTLFVPGLPGLPGLFIQVTAAGLAYAYGPRTPAPAPTFPLRTALPVGKLAA